MTDATLNRWIPSGYTRVTYAETVDAVAYVGNRNGFYAIGYSGKRTKQDFHISFRSAERRAEYLKKWFEARIEHHASKERYKAERKAVKASDYLKTGDILKSSWGYEQTNVDFYQVIEVREKTVVICEIADFTGNDAGFMTGYKMPQPDEFIGKPMTKRVREGGSVKIASYASAFKWSGEAARYSYYG